MILSLLLATLAQAVPATPPATLPATLLAPSPAGRSMGLRAADADGNGVVTRQEAMTQADAAFARMDADRDGTVTPDERRAAMAAMRDAGQRRGGRRSDRGGDRGGDRQGGATDRGLTQVQAREMAGRRFNRIDANGDGRLDAAELAAARPGPRGGDGAR